MPKPLTFHNRTGHILDPVKVKMIPKLQEIQNFAETNEMSINSQKTKIMIFNKSLKYDFMPEIQIKGENLEVVEEFKILGLVITSDMRWNQHVKYICQRGYAKLWFLRRLKKLGVSTHVLIDLYEKHIRSILEYAAPAWSPMLTAENKSDIERVQKCSYSIIFGPNRYAKTLNNNQKIHLRKEDKFCVQNFQLRLLNLSLSGFAKRQKL